MTNKKHQNVKIMSSQRNQVLIDGNLFYSDRQRKKWRESKQLSRDRLKSALPTEEVREIWKIRQRKYRATMSEEKKEEERRKRRAQRHEKATLLVSIPTYIYSLVERK